VEWATADVIRAAPFERHKVLHHVEYLRRIYDSLYGLIVNHVIFAKKIKCKVKIIFDFGG
jgi:hypothetical protein